MTDQQMNLHLYSLLKVPALKSRLKLKGELGLVDFMSPTLDWALASSNT